MSNVGDIILGFRDLAPDPCQTLSPPSITGISTATSPPLNVYFPGGATVYFKATQLTQWGETLPSDEATATNAANFFISFTVNVSYIATAVRVYFTTVGTGAEDQFVEIPITSPVPSVAITINIFSVVSQAIPPIVSRAWIPESDGNILSVTRLYGWLNEGLKMIGQLTGGVRDITGLPSTQGQAQYQVVNSWQAIDNNFYDGYPIAAGTKQQIFRRSSVTGLSGVVTVNVSADRQIVELWPQSQRTAGTGVISTLLTSTATTLQCAAGNTGFVLPLGLILIGTYPPTSLTGAGSCELVYYSQNNGTSIGQLTRGMGGTQAQQWPVGTNFYECNIYLTGKRSLQLYTRGQSALTFTAPPAYEDAIRQYLLYRFRDAEQNSEEAKSKLELCKLICDSIRPTQQIDGPRRIQVGGTGGVETVVGLGSPFGGVILP